MESKAHYKKCLEKGVNPQSTPLDDTANPEEDQTTNTSTDRDMTKTNDDCDAISDEYSDGDELEIDIESSGKVFLLVKKQKQIQSLGVNIHSKWIIFWISFHQ